MTFHSDLFGWEYVWRNFAEQHGGEGVDNIEQPGLEGLSIPLPALGATIVLTPFVHQGKKKHKGTTAMAAFRPADDFVFSIQTETWTAKAGKVFGAQDVQVADELFDSRFLIQGNDDRRIQTLFSDVRLREAILLESPSQLRIETDSSHFDPEWTVTAGDHALVCRYDHLMEKYDQLQTAFDVVKLALQQLITLRAVRGATYAGASTMLDLQEEDLQAAQPRKLHSPLLDRS